MLLSPHLISAAVKGNNFRWNHQNWMKNVEDNGALVLRRPIALLSRV